MMRIELLAPAKNKEVAIKAINCGADAIYMGASKFGARSSAGNSIEDIKYVVDYAHQFNVKVYVTINTIIKDDELLSVESLITELYNIKVDALIVQDMGILRLNIPPISLHASTQCDIRSVEKAKFLESVGFSQLVLARELSLSEIHDIHNSVNIPLEGFIHGALCVSYSGKCHASQVIKKRSANRGECAQLCRLPYDLVDSSGKAIFRKKHLLSLKDMNQSENIEDLIDAGITSFKIEGRLKDSSYVCNVVAYYRKKIDEIISNSPDKYQRSSIGKTKIDFEPKLDKSFNRGFTTYFVTQRNPEGRKLASFNTPKSLGEYVGKVTYSNNKDIKYSGDLTLNNGDGLSYFDDTDSYQGFRVNNVESKKISTLRPMNIKHGTLLYRTFDKNFNETIESNKTIRKISLSLNMYLENNVVKLSAEDERGNSANVIVTDVIEPAKTDQTDTQIRNLSKLGNTIYKLQNIATRVNSYFIPASILSDAKRRVLEVIDAMHIGKYQLEARLKENKDTNYILSSLDFRENVSNHKAEEFYKSHGVNNIERAIEVSSKPLGGTELLMNTRYCILREIGVCKKDPRSIKYSEPLILKNEEFALKLEFDCKNCEMKIRKF